MNRPACFEHLTASRFYNFYDVRKLAKNRVNYNPEHVFISNCSNSGRSSSKLIAIRRVSKPRRPEKTHVLNVASRGHADDSYPYFAAAALVLHVPFRSPLQLLDGMSLTDKLNQLILQSDSFPDLCTYVRRSRELAEGISSSFSNLDSGDTSFQMTQGPEKREENDSSDSDNDIEDDLIEERANPLLGLPPVFTAGANLNPLKVATMWQRPFRLPSATIPQYNKFREYVRKCRTIGLQNANAELIEDTLSLNANKDDDDYPPLQPTDPMDIMRVRGELPASCRNTEQKS